MQEILSINKKNGIIYLIISLILFGVFIYGCYLLIVAIGMEGFPFYQVVLSLASIASSVLFFIPALNIISLKNPIIVVLDEKLVLYPNNKSKKIEYSLKDIKIELQKSRQNATKEDVLLVKKAEEIHKIYNGINIVKAKNEIDELIKKLNS
ncbi:hypothetical protein LJC17_01290 [Acholeplasma sp. OttesenSCG-928-E16]|nr:hypothetical protein [Acholeplasma sp. OttesenSCG-928-E16]